jgi:tRNA-2-methylthio-N6-dimethylallyladenosine synthase
MKRGYTAEYYRDMLRRIYETIPGAAVTSDFIVGFCGETEADFEQTVDLVREGRFKNSFIFKYSPRPGTKAAERFADDVPEEVKRRRNNELLALQNAVSLEDNRRLFLGRHRRGPRRGAQQDGSETGRRGRRAATRRPHRLRPHRRLRRPVTR